MLKPKKREKILKKAYELWEAEGRPHGQDMEHWLRAELMVSEEGEEATAPEEKAPAKKPAAKDKAEKKAPAKKSAAKKK